MSSSARGADETAFDGFVRDAGPRLRRALVATFGPVDGRAATVDALSWAWLHWERLESVSNKVGYLYRVGQTAVRQYRPRPVPVAVLGYTAEPTVPMDGGLVAALAGLSERQRAAVVLVHAFGWTVRDVAELLEVAPSTVQNHLTVGLARVRSSLEGGSCPTT